MARARLDEAGIAISACTALYFAVDLAGASHAEHALVALIYRDDRVAGVLAVASVALAAASIVPARSVHGRSRPLLLLLAGVALLVTARGGLLANERSILVLSITGALALVWAHVENRGAMRAPP